MTSIMKLLILLSIVAYASAECKTPGLRLDGEVHGTPLMVISISPYVVSLEYDKKHICSGSVIHKTYAVTAAHCVYGAKAAKLKFRSGSASDLSGGSTHPVHDITIHPQYDSANMNYDIALVQVSSKFSNSQVISLASSKPLLNSAYSYGWSMSTTLLDPWVRQVNTPVVNNENCASAYGIEMTDSMICAGSSLKTQCQGDTGSPLVSGGKLLGIASLGEGCSSTNPGVYTSIPEVYTWLKKEADL